MKLLYSLVIGFGIAAAYPQGQVNFANLAFGVNAPVTNLVDGSRISGPAFAAQLFYAAPGTGSNIDRYTPVAGAVPFFSGASAGYFTGGAKTIPGFGNGADVRLITGAFATDSGADFLTARSRGGYTA